MRRTGITLAVIILLVAVAWMAMHQLSGRPISADLSLVGDGQPTLVLAFENYSPASMAAMDQINQVRPEYEAVMHFIVADLGTPQGDAFARRFDLTNGTAILLDGDGDPVRAYALNGELSDLRRALDQTLPKLR